MASINDCNNDNIVVFSAMHKPKVMLYGHLQTELQIYASVMLAIFKPGAAAGAHVVC